MKYGTSGALIFLRGWNLKRKLQSHPICLKKRSFVFFQYFHILIETIQTWFSVHLKIWQSNSAKFSNIPLYEGVPPLFQSQGMFVNLCRYRDNLHLWCWGSGGWYLRATNWSFFHAPFLVSYLQSFYVTTQVSRSTLRHLGSSKQFVSAPVQVIEQFQGFYFSLFNIHLGGMLLILVLQSSECLHSIPEIPCRIHKVCNHLCSPLASVIAIDI